MNEYGPDGEYVRPIPMAGGGEYLPQLGIRVIRDQTN